MRWKGEPPANMIWDLMGTDHGFHTPSQEEDPEDFRQQSKHVFTF
jgi:hypothetical protein